MLETFFEAPFTINRLRTSPLVGNYIDGFAQNLNEQVYAIATARRYLRASGHLVHFIKLKNIGLNAINSTVIKDFQQHLKSNYYGEQIRWIQLILSLIQVQLPITIYST